MRVNTLALGISRRRASKFNRTPLPCVTADASSLPLRDQSIDCVVVFESLHHLVQPLCALQEAWRVLKPGGKVMLYEPYALNPYRRLSELRDRYIKKTIERSFYSHGLRRMLEHAGFSSVAIERHVMPPSEWKMRTCGFLHAGLKMLYFFVARRLQFLFGNLLATAYRPPNLPSGVTAAVVLNPDFLLHPQRKV